MRVVTFNLNKQLKIRLLTLLFLVFISSVSGEQKNIQRQDQIRVLVLFKNAAMIEYQGQQKLLRNGQTFRDIKLISADSHKAKFLIDGNKLTLGLHQNKIGGNVYSVEAKTPSKLLQIPRDNTGMFRKAGFINGVQVQFLIDTGASQVAMNETTARLVGLQYQLKGYKTQVSTASGNSSAWVIKLNKVQLGDFVVNQVEALVIQGDGPAEVLLGMSFLQKFSIHHDGQMLKISRRL
ncbi:MAG: TIGR02281 family clan AA aspartic protease [Enterobacterales bacterium]|nr:TIGR02281 family clan AA aspartic protease [Enterobacterales bacterium]